MTTSTLRLPISLEGSTRRFNDSSDYETRDRIRLRPHEQWKGDARRYPLLHSQDFEQDISMHPAAYRIGSVTRSGQAHFRR